MLYQALRGTGCQERAGPFLFGRRLDRQAAGFCIEPAITRRRPPALRSWPAPSKELNMTAVALQAPPPVLLQIDRLIMPSLIELCTPHPVHALMVGPAEEHGRAEPDVEIAHIFESRN